MLWLLDQWIADHHCGTGELANQLAGSVTAWNRQSANAPTLGPEDDEIMFSAEPMNRSINPWAPHDHRVETFGWNPRWSPTDELIFHP